MLQRTYKCKGSITGRAVRDVELESKILILCQQSGIGAQFGGKYFALDVRVFRLPIYVVVVILLLKVTTPFSFVFRWDWRFLFR